jgi:predicted MFS family arabinose efflux permease
VSTEHIGYIALLRRNKPFRRLWYGQVVSQLGDWFNSIALFTLVLRMTGSGEALGALLVAELLPATLVGPWAGTLVDRLPRKLIMIVADVGRALLVVPLLFVRDADDIWMIYVATVLKVALAAFFEPARSAVIPTLTAPRELITANGISGATWSAMLALGAALGGLVAGTLGTTAAFLIDGCSFLLSAVIIATIPIRETHLEEHSQPPRPKNGERRQSALAEGFRYILGQRDITLYVLVKALWSLGGGVLLMLTIFGREIFPLGKEGALSIGLLYAARGVGAAIGPLVVQRFGGSSQAFLRRAIGPSILCTGLGYVLFSLSPTLFIAALAVMVAHMGGSTQWVFSTALLQISVPDRLRGRVFAVELALLTLAAAASSYAAGVASDAGWEPRPLALLLAGVFVLPGVALLLLLWRSHAPINEPIPIHKPLPLE